MDEREKEGGKERKKTMNGGMERGTKIYEKNDNLHHE